MSEHTHAAQADTDITEAKLAETSSLPAKGEWISFKGVIALVALAIGSFHLLNVAGIIVLSTQDIRIVHLMMMLVLLFLSKPLLPRFETAVWDKALRIGLAVISVIVSVYFITRWKPIAGSGGQTVPLDAVMGGVILLLVLEAARRGVGLILSGICVLFFTYPFYSQFLTGILYSRGYSPTRVAEILATTSDGLYGVPLGVSASYIILFCIYGAFLSAFGAGDFFFKLANRVTRNARAAGAKSAVIFSTLLGMISGSAAGNVAVTGALTIPMMKREGYKPHQAGAIEAVVSTGGQMMPPIMGAAAFIMAEIVGVPYSEIMKAALIPALLFFVSIFCVVHLQAGKNGIVPTPTEDDDQPMSALLLSGGQYILPFGALITMMLMGFSPFKASYISILALIVCHVLWTRRIDYALFEKSAKAIIDGSISVIPIAIACAAAGIIAGILGMTGLGSKISGLIISGSGGIMFIALVFTMLTAIILGMGLPTTAAYLILATVVAPALARLGLPPLTAHLFVFFYGCVSTITPPVALASYVAAGIANADINKVGWTGFAFGITAYVLPFMFVFGPALMMDAPLWEIGLAASTGAIGVYAIASGVIGYGRKLLPIWARLLLFAIGLCLLHQGLLTDAIGLVVLAATLFVTFPRKALTA